MNPSQAGVTSALTVCLRVRIVGTPVAARQRSSSSTVTGPASLTASVQLLVRRRRSLYGHIGSGGTAAAAQASDGTPNALIETTDLPHRSAPVSLENGDTMAFISPSALET
jgi:hypothetical protein